MKADRKKVSPDPKEGRAKVQSGAWQRGPKRRTYPGKALYSDWSLEFSRVLG